MPADFFRTMEDASGVDLDWFWRGWFYTTDHCDIAISKVERFEMDRNSPDENLELNKQKKAQRKKTLSQQRNESLEKRANQFPDLKDFYNEYDPSEVTEEQRKAFEKFKSELSDKEKSMFDSTDAYYRVSLKNEGGLVMPVILYATFEDGSTREIRIPAEIWRVDSTQCDTLIVSQLPIKSIELDPYRETADINRDNNYFPPLMEPSRFQLFKARLNAEDNPMQRAKKAADAKAAAEKAAAEKAAAEKAEAEKTEAEKAKASQAAEASKTEMKADEAKSNAEPEVKKEKKKKKKNKKQKQDA